MKRKKKKNVVQHKHFTCNEKETIIKDVVPHKDFACNEKKTIINALYLQ